MKCYRCSTVVPRRYCCSVVTVNNKNSVQPLTFTAIRLTASITSPVCADRRDSNFNHQLYALFLKNHTRGRSLAVVDQSSEPFTKVIHTLGAPPPPQSSDLRTTPRLPCCRHAMPTRPPCEVRSNASRSRQRIALYNTALLASLPLLVSSHEPRGWHLHPPHR